MPFAEDTPTSATGTPDGLLVEVCDALDGELAALSQDGWSTPVLNGWTVHDVVVHLATVNSLLVARLNAGTIAPLDPPELVEASAEARRTWCEVPSDEVLDSWRRSVTDLRKSASSYEGDVGWIGLTVDVAAAVTDRALETWVSGNDVRNAIGRASLDPSAQHFRVLCDLAVRLLPLALAITGRTHRGTLTISLAGSGGGEWSVPLGPDEADEPAVSMCASARDLCLLMGGRIDPRDFAYSTRGEGSAEIVADIVTVAGILSRP